MTGRLSVAAHGFRPGRHDHLVLYQKERALVLTDPRQFGQVLFHRGSDVPEWWRNLPAPLTSSSFTAAVLERFLRRHPKLPIKAALLLQAGFPGIGNWMADEILWRASLHPKLRTNRLDSQTCRRLWQTVRFVCRGALRKIANDYSDPPVGWLFHQRWTLGAHCPRDGRILSRETVGGRTTVWCPKCQPKRR
jgi:formamidopyrimidine-DNA glycosylase